MLIGWLAGVVCAQRALYCLPCHLFLRFNSRNILCLSSPRRPQWASSFWQLLPLSRISQRSEREQARLYLCSCALILCVCHFTHAACAVSWAGQVCLHFYAAVKYSYCAVVMFLTLAIALRSCEVGLNPDKIPWRDAFPGTTTVLLLVRTDKDTGHIIALLLSTTVRLGCTNKD